MPRLRNLKTYEPLNEPQSSPHEGSGNHWLSNEVILGTLPIEKLKASLDYHKNMLVLCQAELSKRNSGIHQVWPSSFIFTSQAANFGASARSAFGKSNNVQRGTLNRTEKRARSFAAKLTKAGLTPEGFVQWMKK